MFINENLYCLIREGFQVQIKPGPFGTCTVEAVIEESPYFQPLKEKCICDQEQLSDKEAFAKVIDEFYKRVIKIANEQRKKKPE